MRPSISPNCSLPFVRVAITWMMRRCGAIVFLVAIQATLAGAELPPAVEKQVDFKSDIFPILEAKCHDCHGEFGQESNFRMDRKAAVLRGGDSGEPGMVLGNSAQSHLIHLVAGIEADMRMPPDEADALTLQEVGLLRAWIDQGAPWPGPHGVVDDQRKVTTDHWAFQPVQQVKAPQVEREIAWVQNPIDQFILAKLHQNGLSPNPPSDRRVLYRRLSLDLLGLPADPAEVEAFAQDDRSDAMDRAIKTMLASPHFGERFASLWLDLVRFAETHGFETNRERPHAWHYRDYVIQSFNEGKPYDQFIREQIAGDSFGEPMGLGYLVAGPYDQVKSPDINLTLMQRQNELDDIINTTSTAFLGLTVGCARCHNHKFDPILQTDYYAMQAIFAGVEHGDMSLPPSEGQKERAEALGQQITQLKQELAPFLDRPVTSNFVLIDDDPEVAGDSVTRLKDTAGKGVNVPGTSRGQADDPGDTNRSPNVSGSRYSWWKHGPDEPVLAWRPRVTGQYRLWLSWGCGYETHCQNAQYVIDRDGDSTTRDDWEVVAIVNQQQFANGDKPVSNEPLWSGFYHAAVVTLDADDQILLVGGTTGTALTADVLLLEEVAVEAKETPQKPAFRAAVSPQGNIENFSPRSARFIRFVIEATNNGAQPCLDELAIFSAGQNVALAAHGGKAAASGSLSGYPIHKLEHINDGRYSNRHSWIADTAGNGWVQIELAAATEIDRIEWSRDREGEYQDRLPTRYRIEASQDGTTWKTIASSDDRLPLSSPGSAPEAVYQFDHLPSEDAARAKQLVEAIKKAESEWKGASAPVQVYAGRYKQPAATHRLYRGEPLAKREQVSPDVPTVFPSLKLPPDTPEAERRKQLAEWIASPENPLTARVIVNRIWQFHFGNGLVNTASDFGEAGVPPSHPELLDWLALELMRNEWSLKHIHRLILQSATYQQSSRPNPAGLKADGGTELLWRYPPRRLQAEPIRDSILAVSGVLDRTPGGPGFSGFKVEAENVRHYHPKSSFGPEDWRRMIYMTKVRMEKDAVFGLFDCPDAATTVAKRSRSTTPLQALNLFNSKFVLQQAELFGQCLESETSAVEQQIEQAFALCYGRPPTSEEISTSSQFIQQQGLTAFCRAILNSNEFLFIQ